MSQPISSKLILHRLSPRNVLSRQTQISGFLRDWQWRRLRSFNIPSPVVELWLVDVAIAAELRLGSFNVAGLETQALCADNVLLLGGKVGLSNAAQVHKVL